jgi:ParB family chromosome partitioning protein
VQTCGVLRAPGPHLRWDSDGDKHVRFIGGLAAYEEAGGTVRRDLFDKGDSGFVIDTVKLESMVADKLQEITDQVRAEGWANVEVIPEYNYEFTSQMQRCWPEQTPLTEEQQTERDGLQAEYDDLETQIDAGEFGDAEIDDAELRPGAIDHRLNEIDNRAKIYAPEVIETGTAFVYLDYHGMPNIQRGFVTREDQSKMTGSNNNNASPNDDAKVNAKAAIAYPATLIESLSAQKTAILRAELMNNTHVALAATVHAMLLKVNGATRYDAQTCLKLSVSVEAIDRRVEMTGGSIALDEVAQRAEQVGETIPGKPADLWEWCLEQSTQQLLDLLAFTAAQSVNVVVLKHDSNSEAVQHSHRLAEALNIDMTGWYQPTGESCFKHLNRNSIQIAVEEAAGSQAALAIASAKKKAEAVVIAERLVKDTNWLPEPMRFKQLNAAVLSNSGIIDDVEIDDDIDALDEIDLGSDDFEEAAE